MAEPKPSQYRSNTSTRDLPVDSYLLLPPGPFGIKPKYRLKSRNTRECDGWQLFCCDDANPKVWMHDDVLSDPEEHVTPRATIERVDPETNDLSFSFPERFASRLM